MSAIRFGICLLVAFAVLAHGAVEPWSESILEIGAAALFLLWGFLSIWQQQVQVRWNTLFLPLLGLAALALLQWGFRLSAYPYLTKVELLKLGAYFLLFFLAVQSFRNSEDWRHFVWFLLAFGFGVALFAILQSFTFNGKIYWFRQLHHGGTPFGPYVNRNHFAGLMELILPLGLAILLLHAARRDKLPLVALFTVVPVGALFLSASRGGITSFLVQVGFLGIVIWGRPAGRKRPVAAAVLLLLAGAFVAWLGVGSALQRLATIRSAEVSEVRRLTMIKDSWHIFLDHPWIGSGVGTLVAVYPRYESFYDGKVVEHAHNDYVETLAETGVIGTLFSLAFLVLLIRPALSVFKFRPNSFTLAAHLGALVGCCGLLLHSLVDFNLHIPSNALLFLLLAALVTSEDPPSEGWRKGPGTSPGLTQTFS